MPIPSPTPPGGLELVKKAVGGLRELVAGESLMTPAKGEAPSLTQKHQTAASLLFLEVKRGNRQTLETVEQVRNSTELGKGQLDKARLRLTNVLYEKSHVQKEIRLSKDFQSEYPDAEVGLCDVNTFMKEKKAVEPSSSVDLDKLDKHALELIRLSHELTGRKALVAKKQELETRLILLKKSVRAKREFLDSLRGHLQKVHTALMPLARKLLTMESDTINVERRRDMAKNLPVCMYVLFATLCAAADSESFENDSISVAVVGSAADAEAMERLAALRDEVKDTTGGGEELHGDDAQVPRLNAYRSETDDDENGDNEHRSSKQTRSGGKRNRTETDPDPDPDTVTYHPLNVTLTVSNDVVVTFRYVPTLRVITAEVGAVASGSSTKSASTRDIDLNRALIDLFPGDDGCVNPNPSAETSSNEWDVTSTLDRPFRWCQHLGGLDFLPAQPPFQREIVTSANSEFGESLDCVERNLNAHASQKRGKNVLIAIRDRLRVLHDMDNQLAKLTHCKNDVGTEFADLLSSLRKQSPTSFVSTMKSFAEIHGDDVDGSAETSTKNHQSGSVLFRRLQNTGSRSSLRRRGARRFVVEVICGVVAGASTTTQQKKQVLVTATLEVPVSFPTKRICFALAVSGTVSNAEPPYSQADASGVSSVQLEGDDSRDACNDLRVMETEVNALGSERDEDSSGADAEGTPLLLSIQNLLRVCDTYAATACWGGRDTGGTGKDTRRGRERRKN